MLRHNIPLVPAELIGHYLGLVVPEDATKYFYNAKTGERPPAGFGTRVRLPEYSPNTMFATLNIPLQLTWKLIDTFSDINEFKVYLQTIEQTDTDVLACYDWGQLFDKPEYQGGHVCVVDRVYTDKNQVRLIDPDFNSPKWPTVDIDKLFAAMKFHTSAKSGGFWEINKTKTN